MGVKIFKRYGFFWIILILYSQAWLVWQIRRIPRRSCMKIEPSMVFLTGRSFISRRRIRCIALSIEWRKEVLKTDDPARRTALQRMIVEAEDSTEIFREMAMVHFAYMNSRLPVEKKLSPYLVKDTVLNGITVYQYRLTDDFLSRLNEKTEAISDEPEPDPSVTGNNFKIYNQSPYSAAQTFEYDFRLPAGVFYRIQLAVYKTRLAPDHFKGLSPITTEKIPDKDLIRYFVGKFYRLEDAKSALVKVRAYGHTDAYIIGYYNRTPSTLNKLQELERHP